jgi:leucyl aminopeptidase (aminopeptidase T)
MRLLNRGTLMLAVLSAGCGRGPAANEAAPADDAATTAVRVDYEAIAQNIVTRAARVREGDRVLITGDPRDQELLEDLVVNIMKQGAHPLLVTSTERTALRSYDDVPARYDSIEDSWNRLLAENADVWISFASVETPGLLAHVPPARIEARSAANNAVMNTVNKRNVRLVEIGNGLYPTSYTASIHGLKQDELARIFWAGIDTDPASLDAAASRVQGALSKGGKVHITGSNGTDFTFQLAGKKALVNDGAVGPEDEAAGGGSVQVYVPAGEVYTVPQAGTANGTVVVPRFLFQGKEFNDVRLTFTNGVLASMEGPAGFEAVKARYDAGPKGKEIFAGVDVGINPGIPATKILGWVPAGMITVGIGNNTWAGGDNAINFGFWWFLPGMTLTIDGTPIVENGVLKT